ncbi:MAG: hypothetical protein EAZ78_12015 [Oscillatoriales cyanobacterium]|nr:MAG: hypothetical protein EAZ78_12015 [Oscillatoriales cyanobacterium]
MPIGVNLTSNLVTDCCLTIKSRSERAPRNDSGGQDSDLSSPFPHPPLGGAGGGGGAQFPIPNSQFPIPNSQFPIPNSQFPIPNSQFPITKYSMKL